MPNKKLIENFMSLLILQGSNYVLPLLTFPFLVRKLGTVGYGQITISTSLMFFLIGFVEFGFNVTATKKIAVHKSNRNYINQVFNNVLLIKLVLLIVSFLFLLLLITLIPQIGEYSTLYLVSFLSVVGSAIFPLWFFQGIEKMKYISIFNITAKFLSTILIFILVNNDDDVLLASFLQSLNYLFPGVISLLYIIIRYKLKITPILDWNFINNELREGLSVFISRLWVNVYVQGPMLLTGYIVGERAAGYYGIGQKIMSAMVGVMQPLGQATYPHMCKLYFHNVKRFIAFKNNLIKLSFVCSLILSILLANFSSFFVNIVSGESNKDIISLVRLFAIATFLIIQNTQVSQIIYVIEKINKLQIINIMAAVFFLLTSIPLTIKYKEYGMVLSVIIVEFIVLLLTRLIIKNNNISSQVKDKVV